MSPNNNPSLPVNHLDYGLVQEYTLNEISNTPKARFACFFLVASDFLGYFNFECILG